MAPSIDFHQHYWPDPFVSVLWRRSEPPRIRGELLELANGHTSEIDLRQHDLDSRLALLDRDEIDVAVISLSPALGVRELPPDDSLELIEAYEGGMLEVSAAASGRLSVLGATSLSDGFAGLCLAADALGDLEEIGPVLDTLEQEERLLFVHPGPMRDFRSEPTWWAEVVDYASQMQRAYGVWLAEGAARWPELRIVFAILAGGGPFQLERLRSRGVDTRDALHPNVYFETASYGRRAIELCLSTYGVGNLVYGSDVPVIDSVFTLDAVRGFGEAVADTLCRENPARLLRI